LFLQFVFSESLDEPSSDASRHQISSRLQDKDGIEH